MIVLLSIFAVGAGILAGLFSVNESKHVKTLASKIHGIGSAIGFMALLFVPLILALLEIKDNNKLTGIVSVTSFVLAVVFFVLFIMADKTKFQETIISKEGLWQRLTLLFMYIPLAYISVFKLISGHI